MIIRFTAARTRRFMAVSQDKLTSLVVSLITYNDKTALPTTQPGKRSFLKQPITSCQVRSVRTSLPAI
jgi:hypothetical protein